MNSQDTSNHKGLSVLPGLVTFLLSGFLMGMFVGPVYASMGTEVFRGFTDHISQQIGRDKQDFYVAQVCTTWFYRQLNIKPDREIEKISAPSPVQEQEHSDFDCSNRYPNGLEAAREAFGRTQQSLSISLTFYQFALVGDRDDDGQYNGGELKDVLESFGLELEDRLPSDRYILALNGMFDTVRGTGEIQTLMNGMGTLYDKGYRFSDADQVALNQELD